MEKGQAACFTSKASAFFKAFELINLQQLKEAMLVVPRVRLKRRGERAFSVAGPRLWNSLSLEIRTAPMLKTRLFSLAFS
ncbi:uncharacterized protein LOC116684203 [Tachysurus ichikawai]